MNGVELAERVRKERPLVPVLLTSGYAAPVAKQAANAGVQLLAKPFAIDALEIAIAQTRQSWVERPVGSTSNGG
ncbi:MAG TPA: hypothetical protein VEF55_08905 [Candidatus Binatia bacterium]|nr:hypothetical protein [Candidatus Binatia bacterium]